MREIYSEKCLSDKRACKRSDKQQEDAKEDAENYYSCAMKQLSHCLSNKSRTNKHWHIANDITRRKQSSGNFHDNGKVSILLAGVKFCTNKNAATENCFKMSGMTMRTKCRHSLLLHFFSFFLSLVIFSSYSCCRRLDGAHAIFVWTLMKMFQSAALGELTPAAAWRMAILCCVVVMASIFVPPSSHFNYFCKFARN